MVGTLFNGLRALLALPARTSRSFKAVEHAVRRIDERADKARHADRQVTTQAFERLRQDVDERFQRLHLQLERITALADPQAKPQTTGERLPLEVAPPEAAPPSYQEGEAGPSEWISVSACGACGSSERTVVCAWNKLALLESSPDERAWRYDFAVCHGCGLMYATEPPVGRRYRYLPDHFEDVVDKVDKDGSNRRL